MNFRNFFRFLLPALLLLGGASVRTGYADWYHDATTNYLEAANWLEESHGDWHGESWYRVGDDGNDSCCSKFAESDPLYLDGTSATVTNEIVVCRNLTGNDAEGSFHIRADLRDDCGPGFRGFALYDFHDGDRDEYPNGLREIIDMRQCPRLVQIAVEHQRFALASHCKAFIDMAGMRREAVCFAVQLSVTEDMRHNGISA